MDEAAAATTVDWREWGEAAFAEAAEADRPLLLSLVTTWSRECREMEETTYADPRIGANVNEDFVPVRVDADRRPRVRERYNMGGFPSTVFLTPSGEILTGATFLGVDGFRGILESVRATWDERGESAGSVPRALREGTPPRGTVDARVEKAMVEQLLSAFDGEFGGWGSDVKFPMPRTVEFALVRARDQATRTLEAIQTHLLDTYDGGFYRFARRRDWGEPQREKLVDGNAALLRAFAHGYRYTGTESYRTSAEQTVAFLTTTAWTGEAFGASQAGDGSYFRLEPTDRAGADEPPVDETVFAGHNGLAVDALLVLAAYTDDDRARKYARRARDHVVSTLVEDGRVRHYRPERESDDAPSGLLLDQARVLTGLTTAWQVMGEPGPATEIADWTLNHLQEESGAFVDGPAGGAGLVDRPLYPLDSTVECADALVDLAALTDDDRYREAAHDAMTAFGGATERMGVEVAHFATVAARLQHPRVVEVGTPAGSDLHRAALRLADHEAVVVPGAHDPGGAGRAAPETVAEGATDGSGRSPVAAGHARLLVDGGVEGVADSPGALEAVLTDVE